MVPPVRQGSPETDTDQPAVAENAGHEGTHRIPRLTPQVVGRSLEVWGIGLASPWYLSIPPHERVGRAKPRSRKPRGCPLARWATSRLKFTLRRWRRWWMRLGQVRGRGLRRAGSPTGYRGLVADRDVAMLLAVCNGSKAPHETHARHRAFSLVRRLPGRLRPSGRISGQPAHDHYGAHYDDHDGASYDDHHHRIGDHPNGDVPGQLFMERLRLWVDWAVVLCQRTAVHQRVAIGRFGHLRRDWSVFTKAAERSGHNHLP
jgi:hypothetical protein